MLITMLITLPGAETETIFGRVALPSLPKCAGFVIFRLCALSFPITLM